MAPKLRGCQGLNVVLEHAEYRCSINPVHAGAPSPYLLSPLSTIFPQPHREPDIQPFSLPSGSILSGSNCSLWNSDGTYTTKRVHACSLLATYTWHEHSSRYNPLSAPLLVTVATAMGNKRPTCCARLLLYRIIIIRSIALLHTARCGTAQHTMLRGSTAASAPGGLCAAQSTRSQAPICGCPCTIPLLCMETTSSITLGRSGSDMQTAPMRYDNEHRQAQSSHHPIKSKNDKEGPWGA